MVRGRDDDGQHEGGVEDTQQDEEGLFDSREREFGAAAEEAGVEDQRAADGEGVAEVEAWHGGQLVHVLPALPDGLRVVVADGVVEAVFRREQPRGHARPDAEDAEGDEVAERHCAAGGGEGGVVRGGEVVPADEEDGAGDVHEGVGAVEEGEDVGVAVHEEVLDADLGEGEEDLRPGGVFGVEDGDAVRFGDFPKAVGREEHCGEDFRGGVEAIVERPVEHLDQEGEFLDEAAVVVIDEAG